MTTIRSASTYSTMPFRSATMRVRESRAIFSSSPVPTYGRFGAQQRNRLALHVRAHQRAVGVVVLEERDQAGRGADDLVRGDVHVLDLLRLHHREVALVACLDAVAFMKLPRSVERRVRLRDRVVSSCSAVRNSISSVTRPFFTLRYGVSMNPNSLTRAWMQSDEIRPMFGPSGVSIGQRRP